MKPIFSGALVGALLAAPCIALAQHASHAPAVPAAPGVPDPADPQAAVPPLAYRSVFAGAAHPPAEDAPTPDKLWRQANDTVAAGPGHAGHGAGHEHGQPVAPAQSAAPAPAAPAAHGKHH
ncbi:hypothetical protein [Massilia sp. GCM10023247]|uniref:hypothetical protein n=1 Tax=Massilia sp. GCM10023247 TaxID=3252643 RepID=UPI003620538A